MAEEASARDVDSMSFEEALAELETIVGQLERGQESLARGVDMYERGVSLKARCEFLLGEARMKVERIELGEGGTVSAREMQVGEGRGEGKGAKDD